MPTHRNYPENQQDKIRYFGMIKDLVSKIQNKYENIQVKKVLNSLYKLIDEDDFWKASLDGLAVFAAPGFFKVFNSPVPFDSLSIVSDSFHIKPLLQFMQSADRFQVLALNLNKARLYEGNRFELCEIELLEDVVTSIENIDGDKVELNTEKFFRAVDRSILNFNSDNPIVPLILAALPDHHNLFHKVSGNHLLEKEGINTNPEALSLDELKEKSWDIIKLKYDQKIIETIEAYSNAKAKNWASDNIQQILEACLDGQVDLLILEANKIIFGRINSSNCSLDFIKNSVSGEDDLLDDLAQLVLKMGGHVLVLSKKKMPTKKGLAAIYRYKINLEVNDPKNTNQDPIEKIQKVDKQLELDKDRAASEGMMHAIH
jgi:hypothetical protein